MATFLRVEFTVTLMRLTEHGYVESGDRPFTYFFAAPDAWAGLPQQTLESRVFAVAEKMYADTNRRLQAAEPSDVNYLKVKWTRTSVLGAEEANTWPWLSARAPVWDPTPCAVVNADLSYTPVNPVELAHAVPVERDRVRLDRVLPALLSKQLPACSEGYGKLYEQFRDPRPLDERSRYAWGAAVYFFCVLDRLATGGEYPDPFATVDEMIGWLAEGGEAPRADVESARQIYRKMLDYHVYRPNDTLFQMVYERAWSVRYSDLEIGKPSAFQGFIQCLTSCRDTLHNFDFDDPRPAAAPRTRVFEKIDAFNKTAVLPAFAEIKATLERHGKRVLVAEDDRLGDAFLEDFYREIHPTRRYARELETSVPDAQEIASGQSRYLGYSLVAVDAEEPTMNRYAGKFFETIVFVLGPGDRVYASPIVFYHMKFDDKLHGFAHRFDNNIAAHEIEAIDKYAIQNHFLGAYDYFKINARRDERPW